MITKPTPHFTKGRSGYKPEVIVLHIIDGSQTSCDNWFANPTSGVSANYSIGFTGEIHQYVKDEDTAYAQGTVFQPSFTLYKPGVNPNLYCISIEHEGKDLALAPEAQLNATVELIKTLCTKHNIIPSRDTIIGHYQIRSSKPNCPAGNKEVINTIVTRVKGQSSNKEAIKAQIRALLEQL